MTAKRQAVLTESLIIGGDDDKIVMVANFDANGKGNTTFNISVIKDLTVLTAADARELRDHLNDFLELFGPETAAVPLAESNIRLKYDPDHSVVKVGDVDDS